MGLPKTVEWVFLLPPDQTIALLQDALKRLGGTSTVSGKRPLALSASLGGKRSEWYITVVPADEGSRAKLTVEMAERKHKRLLDQLAQQCEGRLLTSREEASSNLVVADEAHTKKLAKRKSDEERAKRAEKSAKREARQAKLKEDLEKHKRTITLMGTGISVQFDGLRSITVRQGFGKRAHELDEHVSATVESGGNLRTHPTLTRTVAGFALTGTPIGAASWKKQGSLFLLLEGQDWAELIELNPKKAGDAQKFAQQVNLAARTARKEAGVSEATVAAGDTSTVIDQLERLTKLREQGSLTDEEFEAQKRRVLSQ